MNKETVTKFVSSNVAKMKLWGRKNAPEIMLGAAIVTGAFTLYEVGKGTLKAKEIVDSAKEDIQIVNKAFEQYKDDPDKIYTEETKARDLTTIFCQTGGKLLRVYSPAVIGLLVTGALIGGSYSNLKKSNQILSAAYIGLNEKFKAYRDKVGNEIGVEKAKDLYYGIKNETVTETVEDENGKKKKVKKDYRVEDGHSCSAWSVTFNEEALEWSKYPDVNEQMIANVFVPQINELCHEYNSVMCNDILEVLGLGHDRFSPNTLGFKMGFPYDPNNRITVDIQHLCKKENTEYGVRYRPYLLLTFVDEKGNGPINLVD